MRDGILSTTSDAEDVDSDEEELVGEKCISLLSSLLPPSVSLPVVCSPRILSEIEPSMDDQLDEYHVQIRPKPLVPPKPPMDTLRYSMNNIKESADWQLDELLEELEALETQLNSTTGGNDLLLGMPSTTRTTTTPSIPSSTSSNEIRKATTLLPQMPSTTITSSCSSPDGDSAFGDTSSTESSHNTCRISGFSSNESCTDSLNTPSPTQVSPRNDEPTAEELKAIKIRQALEKMKEAKVTKIFVKFFVEDGQPLQLLIDERWTVAETMKQLAEKNHIPLMEDHCIVEEFPELYIQRVFEDHEKLVENIQLWVQDSPNKLHFIRRSDKYSFLDRPDVYLVTEKTEDIEVPKGDAWTREVKQQFTRDYFNRDPVVPPEMEGFLHIKSDGRKSWKKQYFVLRPSGLYMSKKKETKSSKDLTCLMNLHSNQVYTGINWQKKYKAPTPYCICIKLTALQMKRSQYIKYICAEDEQTYKKWLVALRIAKNGSELLKNFERACQIRLETLGGAGGHMSHASSFQTIHDRSSSAASSMQLDGIGSHHHTAAISVNTNTMVAPSFSSERLEKTSLASPSRVVQRPNVHSVMSDLSYGSEEQLTGTIKRAPIDIMRRASRASSSSASPSIPLEESDSDEEFPAPPPMMAATTSSIPATPPPKPAYYANKPPIATKPPTPVKPATAQSTPLTAKKAPPPPPPKRSDATKIQSTTASPQHMSDLEAALAKRRERLGEPQSCQ